MPRLHPSTRHVRGIHVRSESNAAELLNLRADFCPLLSNRFREILRRSERSEVPMVTKLVR